MATAYVKREDETTGELSTRPADRTEIFSLVTSSAIADEFRRLLDRERPAWEALLGAHQRLLARSIHVAPKVSSETYGLIYGLTMQGVAAARAAMPLFADPVLIAVTPPLTRQVLECGVVAQWVSKVPRATAALFWDARRSREQVIRAMEALGVPGGSAYVDHLRKRLSPVLDASVKERPSFRAICDEFEEGPYLYLFYRELCGGTHAGIEATENWIADNPGGRPTRLSHADLQAGMVAHRLTLALGWTLSALDRIVQKRPLSAVLAEVATMTSGKSFELTPRQAEPKER